MKRIFNGLEILPEMDQFKWENRAFKYGDGLFESMRIENFQPRFLDDHFVRLESACQTIGIETNNSLDTIKDEIEFISKDFKDAILRLSVIRKSGGKYLPLNNNFDYLIEIQELAPQSLQSSIETIGIYSKNEKPISDFGRFKTTSSILYVLASIFAKENGYEDVLIKNTNGNIIEATSSNVFVRRGNQISTPPLSDGPIDGVMRKQILKLSNLTPYYIVEQTISETDLNKADEIFLTNSVKGIVSVTSFNNKLFKSNFAKSLHTQVFSEKNHNSL
ncbi:MAG: aminotransferase class IV [Bacteroidales bacterium]|nr:aminotransferase class IV [Bacteroidales bacterium]